MGTEHTDEGKTDNVVIEDLQELEDFLIGDNKYYTSEQKRVSDVHEDGHIDQYDYDLLNMMFIAHSGLDFNEDDSVDVADIGALVSATLEEELTDEQIEMFDVNNDGIVNVIDIVAVINQILGGS